MEDSLSLKSSDSTATSDEYEIVAHSSTTGSQTQSNELEQPLLKIIGNGDMNDLQKSMGEVLTEEDNDHKDEKEESEKCSDSQEEELEPIADVCQECTLFGCITYLGSAAVNAPKSETEILRNMAILNEQSSDQMIKVSISVPNASDGVVVLYDDSNKSVMARYDLKRVMFYSCGSPSSSENSCFAFTYLQGDSQESAIFPCHVFRCDIPEAVKQVTMCFGRAFHKVPPVSSATTQEMTTCNNNQNHKLLSQNHNFLFEIGMEVKEDDGKGNFQNVARDRTAFKLRTNVKKQICLAVQQVIAKDEPELIIERCFGVLVGHGWNIKHSDMQLLDMISMETRREDYQTTYVIMGQWDSKISIFDDVTIDSNTKLNMTVAIDVVINGIKEPVRLTLEVNAKLYAHNERFWCLSRPSMYYQMDLCLKEIQNPNSLSKEYELVTIEQSAELDKNKLNSTWNNLTSLIRSSSSTSLDAISSSKDDVTDDTDEPMPSGTGEVSKECPDKELESWTELLDKWRKSKSRPKQLNALAKQAIPEAFRGEVWQRLTGCDQDNQLLDTYRILISQESDSEGTIQKDINRTFPAHDFFKEAGGIGQDTLFNVSKAYAVYDKEIGYCQGLSFISASLLLHMPEEQAFCVLVKVMYDYGLRNLYRDGFECLYMYLYQLNRLLEEKEPKLWEHFRTIGIETHMFASHWFLTLFAARFPLYFVFYCLDVILVQGLDMLLQIALSILSVSKDELVKLDFENILRYFQVTLPKRCRNEYLAKKIIKRAHGIKLKKLKKYQTEFHGLKEAESKAERYSNELEHVKALLTRSEEEKKQLQLQSFKLDNVLHSEMAKSNAENERNRCIINDYKQICQRLDGELVETKATVKRLQEQIGSCNECKSKLENAESSDVVNVNNVSSNESVVVNRVKELELAQTKLALVEAECRNQDLIHKLNTSLVEFQSRNSYPPWIQKTLSSIKEVTAPKKQTIPGKLIAMTKRTASMNGINSLQ